ncbi:unnamed protein product [Closterium sp. NIES-54]
MTWVYVLSKKSDVAETVKTDWLPMVERQQDRLVKAIRTDRGGEFLSKDFSLWLKKNGMRHSLTMPFSPAMNSIAERAHCTITETARGLLIEAGLPDYFWPDAVRSACVAKNRALTHVGADKWVPYVEWIGRKPKVDMLRVFGCMCMALVHKHLRHNKLGAKAIWAVWGGEEFRFGARGAALGAEKRQHHHKAIFPCVSPVDPLPGTVPVEVAVDSGAARGAASRGATSGGAEPAGAEPEGAESEGAGSGGVEPGGAEPRGAEPGGAEPGGAEPEGSEPCGAESEGAESGGAEPQGTASFGGPAVASPRVSPRQEPLSPQQLLEWFARRTRLWSGAAGGGGSAARGFGGGGVGTTHLGGVGVTAGAGGTGGAGAAGPRGAHTRAGGVGAGGARAGDPGVGGARAGGTRAGGAGSGGVGAGDTGAVDLGAGGASGGDVGGGGTGAGDTSSGSSSASSSCSTACPMYVDDLVFATANTEALDLVISELHKRHTCTDLGEQRNYLGLQITRDRARLTITMTKSHMVHQVLQRFDFRYSLPQSIPLPTGHWLSAPPLDESVEPSGPYPELVGCLMYMMTCTQPDLGYPLSILAHYVAPGRHRPEHWEAAKRVLRNLCSTSRMGLVLGGRGPVVLTGHADASWVDDLATQRSS